MCGYIRELLCLSADEKWQLHYTHGTPHPHTSYFIAACVHACIGKCCPASHLVLILMQELDPLTFADRHPVSAAIPSSSNTHTVIYTHAVHTDSLWGELNDARQNSEDY